MDDMTQYVPDTVYTYEEWSALQVFVPYPDFERSAQVLDRPRLVKQRAELVQVLNSLGGVSRGWLDHPATRMWAGYEVALIGYGVILCDEIVRRGYVDHTKPIILNMQSRFGMLDMNELQLPPWWGGKVHVKHRARLVLKEHYRNEPPWYAELWPDLHSRIMRAIDQGTINSEDGIEYEWPTPPWDADVKRGPRVPSRADIERDLRAAEASRRDVPGTSGEQ